MKWFLVYLVLTSDVNHNWGVSPRSQEMPSETICIQTGYSLEKLATVRRQFIGVRCEQHEDGWSIDGETLTWLAP